MRRIQTPTTRPIVKSLETLADRIQVINHGTEIARGTVAEIAAQAGTTQVSTFTTSKSVTSLIGQLGDLAHAPAVTEQAGRWQVRVPWRSVPQPELIRRWAGSEELVDLVTRPPTLEESYLSLVASHAERDAA